VPVPDHGAGNAVGPAGAAKATGPASAAEPAAERCPLCGTPLAPDQDWCLHCGAAARTRLATSPFWKGPIVALAVVAVLALGVLAASLVKIAGKSGSKTTIITTTIPVGATATPTGSAPATTSPGGGRVGTTGSGAIAPGATTPGLGAKGSSTPGATGLGASGLTAPHTPTATSPTTPSTTSVPKPSSSATGEVARRLRELLNQVRKTYGK
jgi:hypothetical protein